MVLLVLVALALVSLSTITLRSSSSENAQLQAQANARMALMLALADLQKYAGSDQRITADGSILDVNATSPYALGVWESWSPELSKNTSGVAPDYDAPKTDRFLRWLVSGNETDLTQRNWALGAPIGQQINLFGQDTDGFQLGGTLVSLENSNRNGGFAWAVTQEATKAKLSVSGPELVDRDTNNDFQVQPRPNVGQSGVFSQPVDGWDQRSAKLLDYRQVRLDADLDGGENTPTLGADFTTTSHGLLTNTVDGGLKVDLSLGFEMSDADYEMNDWSTSGKTILNPFRKNSVTDYTVPDSYNTERPLYQPIADTGVFPYERSWDRTTDSVHFHFPVTAVPTFDSLRSFYRIPKHLYQSSDGLTVFERQGDHIATAEGTLSPNFTRPPHFANNGEKTQLAIRPVLDRVMFYYSVILHDDDTPRYAITPIITLWNPYNTALEIEGAVAYQWLDLPIRRIFRGTANGTNFSSARWLSQELMIGSGNNARRQIDPYFFAAITADGNPITSNAQPISFEPGEVRVFVPNPGVLKEFEGAGATTRERTIFLRPVDSEADFDLTGGLSIVPFNGDTLKTRVMRAGDEISLQFRYLTDPVFPQCISLSDATVAKGTSPANNSRGQLIAGIVDHDFSFFASNNGEATDLITRDFTYNELKNDGAQPAFTIEVYHRTAIPEDEIQNADLLYTGNPRQSSMNPFVSNTDIRTGPQYKLRFRAISSSDDLLQISTGSRPAAYYGASQSSESGRNHLSFFEIPRQPLLSLGDFQHADLTGTPYAPANQFGNSWASAYVERNKIIDGADGLEVDHSYLVNEALWDGYFFSGAAPTIQPSTTSGGGTSGVWDTAIASENDTLESILRDFAENPNESPLRNPRMKLLKNTLAGMSSQEFADAMILPEACTTFASHLMVDGAFNVNSTSVEAWKALLFALRGASFDLGDGTETSVDDTPFPRFRDPVGTENDNWHGFRSLTDEQIEELASNIVDQVRQRGPFLSLGEFVNRRAENSALGLNGALQAAIDATSINNPALQHKLDETNYESEDQSNLTDSIADTGVGIPGYLTQADILKSIAPVITVRSDTFTIRTYGEARDNNGNVTAKAWAEATVQRVPEFIDAGDTPDTAIVDLSAKNREFGRLFRIVSFRYLAKEEAEALSL